MNNCFLCGEIKSQIEFGFLYNSNEHISVARFKMLSNRDSIVEIKAYDEQADKVYKNYKQGDVVCLMGVLHHTNIEITEIYKLIE